MSNEMISVPRELLREVVECSEAYTDISDSCFEELRALLAKPDNKADGDFWQWLESAYRDGSEGEEPRFTKYNMEVAYLAGAKATQPQGEAVALQHMAVAEGGRLRWMTGRKMQDCELYALPGGGAIREPLYTRPAEQPAPVAVVLPFEFEHPLSKERRTVALSKRDVFDGMEDYFYDKLGEQICQCESVGETNVVDCNCDEYVHDFEIMQACLDEVARLNPPQQ